MTEKDKNLILKASEALQQVIDGWQASLMVATAQGVPLTGKELSLSRNIDTGERCLRNLAEILDQPPERRDKLRPEGGNVIVLDLASSTMRGAYSDE